MVTVLSAYARQAGCLEDKNEKFWRDLDGVMVGIPENERVIVGGDLNGHVGGRKGGKNSGEVRNTKVIYGEGIATQHKLIVADCEMKICKRPRHINQCERKIKWWTLKDKKLREEFSQKVLGKVKLAESVQEWWKINSAVIRKTGEEVFGLTSGRGVPKDKKTWWWNEEVQKVVKEKKDAKRKWDMSRNAEDGQAYKIAKKEAKRAVAKAKAESVREAYEQLQKNQDMR
ncbi:uncharacterized protein LOC124775571 [Schistocerca piceifrons]|uniref:uncharacterized protein LOC124775571 n=1 Tax=Schistocerca piceifrons TaxID=274613 RepID=UPI001F5F92F6|nr:uncharacterized protein LOC124775571 [Schistocerca piceifrons]